MPDPLHTTPLISTCYNTLINPVIVTCYNYRKDSYFILLCLKPKNTGNIKEIKKFTKDISKEFKKKPLGEDSSLKYLINFKKINLS